MAIGKRRTRPLVMKGLHFRWRCEFNEPLDQFSVAFKEGRIASPDQLIIRPTDESHQLLTVTWAPCRGPVVTPALVRACIEEALQQGWLSERPKLEPHGASVAQKDG